MSLGPHGFYWFVLRRDPAAGEIEVAGASSAVPLLAAGESWENILGPAAGASLEEILPDYLRRRRWFQGQPNSIKSAHITGALALTQPDGTRIALVRVDFRDRESHVYALPLAFVTGSRADQMQHGATGDRRRAQDPGSPGTGPPG